MFFISRDFSEEQKALGPDVRVGFLAEYVIVQLLFEGTQLEPLKNACMS